MCGCEGIIPLCMYLRNQPVGGVAGAPFFPYVSRSFVSGKRLKRCRPFEENATHAGFSGSCLTVHWFVVIVPHLTGLGLRLTTPATESNLWRALEVNFLACCIVEFTF